MWGDRQPLMQGTAISPCSDGRSHSPHRLLHPITEVEQARSRAISLNQSIRIPAHHSKLILFAHSAQSRVELSKPWPPPAADHHHQNNASEQAPPAIQLSISKQNCQDRHKSRNQHNEITTKGEGLEERDQHHPNHHQARWDHTSAIQQINIEPAHWLQTTPTTQDYKREQQQGQLGQGPNAKPSSQGVLQQRKAWAANPAAGLRAEEIVRGVGDPSQGWDHPQASSEAQSPATARAVPSPSSHQQKETIKMS